MLDWLKIYLKRVINKLRSFLRYFKVKYFSLLVGFNNIVWAVKFIFNETCSIFSPKGVRFCLFGLIWIRWSYHLFPFKDWISLGYFGIDEDHDTAFATFEIVRKVLKIFFGFLGPALFSYFFLFLGMLVCSKV